MQPGTPPQDTGWPDAVETDPASLNSAEDLDEDRLRVDPLEEGMDPPERWSGADRFGTTPREESEGPSLDARLAEEEPDTTLATVEDPAADQTEHRGSDEPAADDTEYRPDWASVDIESVDGHGVDDAISVQRDAMRRGQSADEAGGSVAEAMRTPDEPLEDLDEERDDTNR